MSEYRLKPRAITDLDEIWDFTVEHWNETQAERYIHGLREDLEMLSSQPWLGRTRDDLHPGLRGWVYSRHVVFYVPAEWGVEIIRILHSSRDIDRDSF